jgi:hypothetical protein
MSDSPMASDTLRRSVGVWTGSEAIFWARGRGAVYDPETDTWTEMTNLPAPYSEPIEPIGVWAGDRFVVYGGWWGVNEGGVWRP